MVVAGLLGALLTLASLRAADDRQPVLIANTDLPPGSVIEDGALRVARIDAPAELLGALYGPEDRAELVGYVTTTALRSGSLVTRDLVRLAASGTSARAMSFPLPRARAVGGALETGDLVDVLAVDRDAARAGYVMTAAEVLAIDGDDAGPLGVAEELTVTLAVDEEAALRLATALENGVVTLVRATGASAASGAPTFGDVNPDQGERDA